MNYTTWPRQTVAVFVKEPADADGPCHESRLLGFVRRRLIECHGYWPHRDQDGTNEWCYMGHSTRYGVRLDGRIWLVTAAYGNIARQARYIVILPTGHPGPGDLMNVPPPPTDGGA